MNVGVGEDFLHVGEGCRGRGSARRREARGDAHTHNLSRRRARHTPGCPRVEARSSGFGEATWVSRGGASVGTGA